MKAVFEITASQLQAIPFDRMTAQVSRVLAQWMEQHARKQFPRLWKVADQLHSLPNMSDTVHKKRSHWRRLLSVLCLALGIFVLIPGMIAPRDPFLLMIGAGAIALAIFNLWKIHSDRKDKFDKSAAQLLDILYTLPENIRLRIAFSETEIILEDIASDLLQNMQSISYSDLEFSAETEDFYLFLFAGKAMILPKNCIVDGTTEHFSAFLSLKTTLESI